jgi:hypothetical protein
MPDPLQIGDDRIDGELRQYYDELDELTQRALDGAVRESDFKDEMERIAIAALLLAFLLAGGNPEAAGADTELDRERKTVRNSIDVLADDIYDGRYSARGEDEEAPAQTDDEGREKLQNRLVLWSHTLAGVYALGQEFQPPKLNADGRIEEPRLVWRRGGTADPCSDCVALDGVILTADEWRRLGVRPQGHMLECGGWHCLCGRYPTDAPSVGFANVPI